MTDVSDVHGPLSAEFLQKLIDSMKPFRRGEHQVVKGNQRPAMLLVTEPAYGRSTIRLVESLRQVSFARGLPTPRPEAVRVGFSDEAQVMTWTPVTRFTKGDRELIKLNWQAGGTRVYANLIELFQPRSLTVPPGMVMEIPVMTEQDIPSWGPTLLFLVGQQKVRPIQEVDEEDRAEASSQQPAPAKE